MSGQTQRIETTPEDGANAPSYPASIGKYEVVEPIGEGGFGMVYKGFDPFIKRHVAIKTCTSPDKELRQRYYREAEIAGRLDHPNIVRIYDFGTEQDTPYLVQEFLAGGDLDHKIDGRQFVPLPERLLYLIHIARGLAYAHDQGVIHRDVKPANIRILEDGSAKIMDFGVAMLQNTETRLTKDGMAVGTAAYLAPEQVKGETPDNRSDIFSYGVLAYELLTGERPFEQESISATLFSILHDDPKPIALPTKVCPQSLRRLVERCMDKDPKRRPESFHQVLADLDRVRADLRPLSGERDLAGELRQTTSAAVDAPAAPPFDPRIQHAWAPPSIRMQRRRRWTLALAPLSLMVLVLLLLANWDRLPWPGAEPAASPLPETAAATVADAEPDEATPAASESDDDESTPSATSSDQEVSLDEAPSEAEATESEKISDAQPAPAATNAVEPPAPAPPVIERATLTLDRGWHRDIKVSIDGGPPQRLRELAPQRLPPGEHTVRYSLQTPEYSTSQTLRVRLEAGQQRQLTNPIGRPGRLSVQASLGSPQGIVTVDGRALGTSPLRGLQLAPGKHQLRVSAVNDPDTPLASSTVDIRSDRETVITFDLTGQRELAIRYRDQGP